jgi:phosphoribosylformylglycinamidine synthase
MRPRVLVLYGDGINCDNETALAFRDAGADVTKATMRQLLDGRIVLADYDILALPGGFSYGDDIQSGRIMAVRLKYGLGEQIHDFIGKKKPVIGGICNGFQIMTAMGLVPGLDREYTKHTATLMTNESGRFRDDWVRLEINPKSPCMCTRGIGSIELPIRHGEGNFYAPEDVLDRMELQQQIVARYVGPDGGRSPGFPYNPNGAQRDIACICDPNGVVTGLMPHPEAAREVHHHPRWTRDRKAAEANAEKARLFFSNAVEYVRG